MGFPGISNIFSTFLRICPDIIPDSFQCGIIRDNAIIESWLPTEMHIHFFADVVTADLTPRIIDATFFICGENVL